MRILFLNQAPRKGPNSKKPHYNVEKIETGPKGAVISFRDNSFANPEGLIAFIGKQGPAARVR